MKPSDIKFFDQRTQKRNIELGHIKQEDYQKHLKSLPDDAENFDTVSFEDLDPPLETPEDESSDELLQDDSNPESESDSNA